VIPQGFSPNDDGKNDWFNIQGLYNIYLKHELLIYNRYGVLVFKGNNDHKWQGEINNKFPNFGGLAAVGTYYYILNLNEESYQPMVGWVYLNR
jgi:gliding motility-associated-like protein